MSAPSMRAMRTRWSLEVDTFTVPKDGADIEASPDGCVWSNDPAASDTSRRVILVTHTPRAFQIAKHPAITTIKVEPVTGIGDEAFYQIYPTGGPFLWAIKGNTAISIRILTRVKPSPFTLEQEKSKVALLGKAAAARL